ncbi:MAG: ATP cone domain-containing protein, partial [Nevskiales bacterium]
MQTAVGAVSSEKPENKNLPRAGLSSEPSTAEMAATAPGGFKVIRRNGKVTPFDASKIELALTKAFLAVEGSSAAASTRIHQTVKALTEQVVQALTRHMSGGGTVHIEDIQDQVELQLMRAGEHKVARDYVLYREQRSQERAAARAADKDSDETVRIHVTLDSGAKLPLDELRLRRLVVEACEGIIDVDAERIINDSLRNVYDGITEQELSTALTLCARQLIEMEPNYSYVSARLLLDKLRHEALHFLGCRVENATASEMKTLYPEYLKDYLRRATELELVDPTLLQYDLDKMGAAILPERDMLFSYLGLQTLYDRYFIHSNRIRFELPQAFFMRVAMGLAINEVEREKRAIEFYELLSSFDFMSSTPTLFNSGTLRPQLSSCY